MSEEIDPVPDRCACPDGDFRFCHGEVERLNQKLETVQRELEQAKNSACHKLGKCKMHCNCYQDIDWDKPGCVWCQVQEENEGLLKKVVDTNLQVRELTETARELVENDGAGADYDASKAYHAREKLRKLIYSEKGKPEAGKEFRHEWEGDPKDYGKA